MKGSALKNLEMFQKLMGTRCLSNCVLVTTKWSEVNSADGERRERELVSDRRFWKNMISNEARVARFEGTSESALSIIQLIAGMDGIVPRLTKVLCLDGKQLKNTSAGQVVSDDLRQVIFPLQC
jgi:hypothetical protein